MLKLNSKSGNFKLAPSKILSSKFSNNKYLSLCLVALAMIANVQCGNEVDCLNFSDPSSVTTLIDDASTTDTLVQTVEITAGGTCRFTNLGITKIVYNPDKLVAKYTRYTGSGSNCKAGSATNCPSGQWYSKA